MSDVLRLIAGGLLALICAYAGVLVRKHYSAREKLYGDLEGLCTYLKNELSFKKTPIPEAVTAYADGKKGEFAELAGCYVSELKSKSKFLRDADTWEVAGLKKDEKKELLDFLSGLGKSALDGQLAHVGRWQAAFEERREKCAVETKRLGGTYFKLLVLLGIAILVLVA